MEKLSAVLTFEAVHEIRFWDHPKKPTFRLNFRYVVELAFHRLRKS